MARGTEQSEPRGRPRKKRRAPGAEKTPRKRPEKRPAGETRDVDRMAAEELGGESEYSMNEAQRDERGTTHRKKIDAGERDHVDVDPDPADLGRRYLEAATQAPAEVLETDEEPVITPHEPD